MKKKLFTALTAAALMASLAVPAYAGSWKQDKTNGLWRYDVLGRGVEDGFLKNQWAWLDGNYDGTSECYYFDAQGYMAASTEIDGSTVNELGQWTVDGIVQTKREGQLTADANAEKTDLIAAGAKEFNWGSVVESAVAANGSVWENALVLNGSVNRAPYAEFDLSGKQKTMTLVFAPEAGQTISTEGRVTVNSQTSGKSLYRSDLIKCTSAPIQVTINCQGETKVRVGLVRGFNVVFKEISVQ